jgi:hypothetical protein
MAPPARREGPGGQARQARGAWPRPPAAPGPADLQEAPARGSPEQPQEPARGSAEVAARARAPPWAAPEPAGSAVPAVEGEGGQAWALPVEAAPPAASPARAEPEAEAPGRGRGAPGARAARPCRTTAAASRAGREGLPAPRAAARRSVARGTGAEAATDPPPAKPGTRTPRPGAAPATRRPVAPGSGGESAARNERASAARPWGLRHYAIPPPPAPGPARGSPRAVTVPPTGRHRWPQTATGRHRPKAVQDPVQDPQAARLRAFGPGQRQGPEAPSSAGRTCRA